MLSFFYNEVIHKEKLYISSEYLKKKCLNEKKRTLCVVHLGTVLIIHLTRQHQIYECLQKEVTKTVLSLCFSGSAQLKQYNSVMTKKPKQKLKTISQYKEHFKFFTEVQSKFKRRKSTRQHFFPLWNRNISIV